LSPALVACSVALAAPVASFLAAGAAPPQVAVSVSPARVALVAPGSRRVKLRNDGAARVVVDVTNRRNEWFVIRPVSVRLDPGRSTVLTLRATRSRRAEPGDHRALVVLMTRPLARNRVNVRLRLGVRVALRVPGRVIRRLSFGGIRVRQDGRARSIIVAAANSGNVTVGLRRVTATLIRHGRASGHLRSRTRRALRPGGHGNVELPYRGRLRGPVTVVVRAELAGGAPAVERRYRIRL
jgi:hypothetical protein